MYPDTSEIPEPVTEREVEATTPLAARKPLAVARAVKPPAAEWQGRQDL